MLQLSNTIKRKKGFILINWPREGLHAYKLNSRRQMIKSSESFSLIPLTRQVYLYTLSMLLCSVLQLHFSGFFGMTRKSTLLKQLEDFGKGVHSLTTLVHLCLKRLSHLILSKVVSNEWKGIRVGRIRVVLSHLFFAGDRILLIEASCCHLNDVWEVLRQFEGPQTKR